MALPIVWCLWERLDGAGLTTIPSDEAYAGVSVNLTCGEAIAAGDAVYYKSDGKIYKSNAGAIATMPVMGLAMSAGTSAGDTTILILGAFIAMTICMPGGRLVDMLTTVLRMI